jgi:hypothetical protein
MKATLWTIILWLFLSGQFVLVLGAETDKQQEKKESNTHSNSDVADFSKTRICGYQLGTIMDDSLLKDTRVYSRGSTAFNVFNFNAFSNYPPRGVNAVWTYQKDLEQLKFDAFDYETRVFLFHEVLLFCSSKDRKLVAICLKSLSRASSQSELKDLFPIVEDIFQRKYNITKWNNMENKYFDFLKKNEYTNEADRDIKKRQYFFDDKTLVYLLGKYRSNNGIFACELDTYFIDIEGLEASIEFINEEKKKEGEKKKQEELDKKERKEQEIKKELKDAENRL